MLHSNVSEVKPSSKVGAFLSLADEMMAAAAVVVVAFGLCQEDVCFHFS